MRIGQIPYTRKEKRQMNKYSRSIKVTEEVAEELKNRNLADFPSASSYIAYLLEIEEKYRDQVEAKQTKSPQPWGEDVIEPDDTDWIDILLAAGKGGHP